MMVRKDRPALRILGKKVRYYRKLKGLSQAELAKDICTQATISLIEKRNKVPSMNILMRLINRLGVTLDDVVVENQDKNQLALNDIDQLVRHGQYESAETRLTKLDPEKLPMAEDTKRYYYFKGMVELFAHRAPDEAIYFFGRVLNPLLANEQRDLVSIMATLGLGLAYAEKGTHDRARVYIDQALMILGDVPLGEGKYLDVQLTIFWHMSRIYYQLAEFDEVLKYAMTGITTAVQHDSLFLLAELYGLQALAQRKTGSSEAEDTYAIAHALAKLHSASTVSLSATF